MTDLRSHWAHEWAAQNPVLRDGEPGYDKTSGRLKVGNGRTRWNDLNFTTGNSSAAPKGDIGPTGPVGPQGPPGSAAAVTDANMAAAYGAATGAKVAADPLLKAAYVASLPTVGGFTYNADGTIASDPDGSTYTWNADGTPATQTKGGVTRTFHWNTDGTLASVS